MCWGAACHGAISINQSSSLEANKLEVPGSGHRGDLNCSVSDQGIRQLLHSTSPDRAEGKGRDLFMTSKDSFRLGFVSLRALHILKIIFLQFKTPSVNIDG